MKVGMVRLVSNEGGRGQTSEVKVGVVRVVRNEGGQGQSSEEWWWAWSE